MNKKQIEAMIKEDVNNIEVPDLKSQILAQIPNRKVVYKESKKPFRFAFRLSYLSIFLVLIVGVILMVNGFDNNSFSDGKTEEKTQEVANGKKISNVEKSYARQAATLIGFAGGFDSEPNNMSAYLSTNMDPDYDEIAGIINQYFKVASNLMNEENTTYEFEVLNEGNYQYKLVIKNAILNDSIETIMYYNEEAKSNNDKDDLDEVSTHLEGIIEQDGMSYEFYGDKEIEGHECEVELVIKIDDTNYLKVSQEIEHNEKEFEYKFYDCDPKKNKAYKTVEIEIENHHVSIEIEEDGEEFEIEFKYNGNQVNAKYHRGNENFDDIKIGEDENNKDNYNYDFGDGKNHSVKKGNKNKDSKTDMPSETGDYPSETLF